MRFLFIFLVLVGNALYAQDSAVEQLDTIVLKPLRLKEKSVGQKVLEISQETVKTYRPQLTDVLNFESPIYFKENGLGMESSASFRGTTAQQTAVLWNGININSQFLGQADFNTLPTYNYSSIQIRSGGGSSQFGSGAIGGTVLLQNKLDFNRGDSYSLYGNKGSYDTHTAAGKMVLSKKNFVLNAGLTYYESDNDYKHFTSGRENENGQFNNLSATFNAAYKIDTKNKLTLFTEWFSGERHFSILEATQTKTKYQDDNLKTQLVWNSNFKKFTTTARLAYLNEKFTYFPKLSKSQETNYGRAQSLIAKYNLGYKPQKNLFLEASLDHKYTWATGSSIQNSKRNLSIFRLFAKHQLTKNWVYQINLNTQYSKDFENPLLYHFGTNYTFSEKHEIRGSFSKNYRIPTFNDLYWPGAGNLDLKPETSHQIEVSYLFSHKAFQAEVSLYQINLKDMIRWLPSGGSVWKPVNTDKVTSKGLETTLNYRFSFGENHFKLSGIYAYTNSENKKSNKQLIYVPFHKATARVVYNYKSFEVQLANMFNGEVYTQSDNNPETAIENYWLSNLALRYSFGENATYTFGGRIRNLGDKEYFNKEYKPMPGINYELFLTINL
ncbi:TonB-dependent receptor plug domain-containing protein [Haloflavibacter putidus]|uniref:TonB-dependent receptor n=1 Tax=Haloflavibacter putidus TaxID=2576776 RepID=A0A507ZN31_9FLAO|nr:TonB-dependent receptor [Haloflavibacter putidus]TQD39136.1 TonB-dependent receptor [Haloflavibacter putidus]